MQEQKILLLQYYFRVLTQVNSNISNGSTTGIPPVFIPAAASFSTAAGKGGWGWCSAQRIKILMIAGGAIIP